MNKLRSARLIVPALLALIAAAPAVCACIQSPLPAQASSGDTTVHDHGAAAEHDEHQGETAAECATDCAEHADAPVGSSKVNPKIPAPDIGAAAPVQGVVPTLAPVAALRTAWPPRAGPPPQASDTLVALRVLLLI